jgi:hypothetical protein
MNLTDHRFLASLDSSVVSHGRPAGASPAVFFLTRLALRKVVQFFNPLFRMKQRVFQFTSKGNPGAESQAKPATYSLSKRRLPQPSGSTVSRSVKPVPSASVTVIEEIHGRAE